MRNAIKKWSLRLMATGLLIIGILLLIVFKPSLSYAHKTRHKQYTVFHNAAIDPALQTRLNEATQLTAASELYNPKLALDICLNEGSLYPGLMWKLQGPAFAVGFYNKVVLLGNTRCKENYVEINDHKWNLTQLLAHEMVHCFQFNKRGFWKSNPVAQYPMWKWEGYPEYIARSKSDQRNLVKNINHLIEQEQKSSDNWITFSDSTGTVIPYYKGWLLMQYCLDIKKMTYAQVLEDTTSEKGVEQQMMDWYGKQQSK